MERNYSRRDLRTAESDWRATNHRAPIVSRTKARRPSLINRILKFLGV